MPTSAVPLVRAHRADYGLDAPGVVYTMLGIGIALGTIAIALHVAAASPHTIQRLAWMGGSFMLTSAMMVLSSRVGKIHAREGLLDRVALAPSDRVLDAGCGHGLLLIGAARRVPDGRAVGVDLWSQTDQKANSAAATLANADAEGVRDRVDVHDGDVRALPFPDASFDVVVSSLVLHNIPSRADRRRAIQEIARVLRPGGRVGLMDIAHVGEYAAALRAAGMSKVQTHGFTPWIFPPTRVLTARK